jgi:hypothetical protein
MSLLLGGSRAAARGGAACLSPTVVFGEEMKEDTMVMTLLGYRAVMAELHIDDRRRETRTARKVRAARRRKGV